MYNRTISTFALAAFLTVCFTAFGPGNAALGQDTTMAEEGEMGEEMRDMRDEAMPDAAMANTAAIDSGYVEVNGARIFYIEAGEGTPMVLVHGWPLGSGLFARNIPALAEEYHVIAVDLRGFGQSEAPGEQSEASVSTYAQDVLAVMDELDIEQALIGGMSMGGPIVFSMYEEAPERFMGMLLIDTIAAAAAPPEMHLWIGWGEYIEANGVEAIPGYAMDEMLTAEARMEAPELVNQVKSLMMNASMEGAIAGANALATRPNFRPMLGEIDVPTLIIVGRHDTIYPYEISKRMQSQIEGAELVILEGGSHAAILEKAEAANEAILTWADGMTASSMN